MLMHVGNWMQGRKGLYGECVELEFLGGLTRWRCNSTLTAWVGWLLAIRVSYINVVQNFAVLSRCGVRIVSG